MNRRNSGAHRAGYRADHHVEPTSTEILEVRQRGPRPDYE
jgi:hypothetical protein